MHMQAHTHAGKLAHSHKQCTQMHKCMIAMGLTGQIQTLRRAGLPLPSLCDVSSRSSVRVCVRVHRHHWCSLHSPQRVPDLYFRALAAPPAVFCFTLNVCVFVQVHPKAAPLLSRPAHLGSSRRGIPALVPRRGDSDAAPDFEGDEAAETQADSRPEGRK